MTDQQPNKQADLRASQIVLRYGPEAPPVLAGLTLTLRAGELVGVVGPNGAGKSSLIRALARTLAPAKGAVTLRGRDLYRDLSARESAQGIAVVPQDTSVAFDFSVREVVEMGRSPRLPRRPFAAPGPADDAAVAAALDRAGVAGLAERPVTTLSGGERQRVLLARALAQDADVLLLDEPTAHLDLRHQAQTLVLAREMAHAQGRAVLAVLHDLNLAAAHCDRLLLLHGGVVAAHGTPAEVLTAARIQAVYGARVWVRRHPVTGRPFLLPLPEAPPAPPTGRTALVLCGNGTGASLMDALLGAGFRVTCGGLNTGDADAEAAAALGIPFPVEAPFSPLSEPVIAETERLALEADVVLLSDTPFGPANVALLEAALTARRAGKPLVCVQPPDAPFAARDFTGGAASRLWDELRAAGALLVPDAASALAVVRTG